MLKLIILKFLNFLGQIPILKEFERFEWFEWFEWFGPSPIEPFNSGRTDPGARTTTRTSFTGTPTGPAS
jgi:hypothetical protein